MFRAPAAKEITRDEAKRAATLLDVTLSDDPSSAGRAVRSAYRAAVRRIHPDAGADPEVAAWRLQAAREARDTLLAWITQEAARQTCGTCRGRGTVPGPMFTRKPCPDC